MNKLVVPFIILFFISAASAQDLSSSLFSSKSNSEFSSYSKSGFSPTVSLGMMGGVAKMNGNTGYSVGLFAELRTETFSFVPLANYWKTNVENDFEAAGLVRLRFKSGSMEPYADGGIGVNFLSYDNNNIKLGLDLGGGLDFTGAGSNYSLFIDAKYKVIVGDPNIKGFTVNFGLKFTL
ncbi:MAG: hypothetical protein ACP5P3_07270 [Ignavibacteria bacterium]